MQGVNFMEIILKDKSWGRSSFELMRTKGMTRTAEEIYTVLLDRCTKANSTIKISTSELARITGRCLKSIINAVKRLIQLKLINKAPKQQRTETNSFIVVKVLDDKKKDRSVTAEQPAPISESVQIQPEPEKPKKKKYGNHGRIRLTDEEYSSLIADFGEEKVSEYIQKADDYSKDKNRWYNNNAQTIRQWLEEDKNKPSPSNDNWYGYKTQKMRARKAYMMNDDVKRQEMEEIDEYLSLVNNFDELDE